MTTGSGIGQALSLSTAHVTAARFLLALTSSYQAIAFGLTQSQIVALLALAVDFPLIGQALGKARLSRKG